MEIRLGLTNNFAELDASNTMILESPSKEKNVAKWGSLTAGAAAFTQQNFHSEGTALFVLGFCTFTIEVRVGIIYCDVCNLTGLQLYQLRHTLDHLIVLEFGNNVA